MRRSSSERTVRRCIAVGAALLASAGTPAQAQPAGDAKLGASVFSAECAECHSVRPGKHKKGPTLFAVFGRRPAEIAEFKYSDAMRHANWTWDADTLRRYITQPREAVPGGTMKYDVLRDSKALNDPLAYLASLK